MQSKHVTTKEAWLEARRTLLDREKRLTQERDALARARRDLPWVRVDEPYVFEGPDGTRTLSELFDGKHQLIIYHFMFGPTWDAGCKSCSFWADHFDGMMTHLGQRDVRMVAVSRAPWPKLRAYAERLGWRFPWYSSHATSFNRDYGVSFTEAELEGGESVYNFGSSRPPMTESPGLSVFYREDADAVFHTYSTYARGLDMLNGTYHYLDLVPKGRDEAGLPYPMDWVRRRDEYQG
jgi:predicted dithiol-disulfide oxidoreductase (DUF899 family)